MAAKQGKIVRCNEIDIKTEKDEKICMLFISGNSPGSKTGIMSSQNVA